MHIFQALNHPQLTGMPRQDVHALAERLAIQYQALREQRRHHRRGGDRRPGTRRGVFPQKITDVDRILAAVLAQRHPCNQKPLADLFGVSGGTVELVSVKNSAISRQTWSELELREVAPHPGRSRHSVSCGGQRGGGLDIMDYIEVGHQRLTGAVGVFTSRAGQENNGCREDRFPTGR
ncbi:hypothetical protein HCN51_56015 [Nonomuraea sp. FMUSA5-5]|uniref:Transposase n=1 Tax=Nonomuraea composti TaxID=2720023 RepID=A0ABX1BTH7_9ACTN|nr:hypothetical protein [Nonomuraea sp. FMUSA5-5]NJP98631.1 hypothetical protein [Nonomuraea sp. FMUSA5-5]